MNRIIQMKQEETSYKDIPAFYAPNRKAWRNWLMKNHQNETSVWLVMYNKGSETQSINVAEAVEEALCFGWIDSKANKRDAESRYQLFAKRKSKSVWSAINKERVQKLTDAGLIMPAGQAVIDLAKERGNWDILNDVDTIPPDLAKALSKDKTAKKNFEAFPPSAKRAILQWLLAAKRLETREKRIRETVEQAAQNIRANQYAPKQ